MISVLDKKKINSHMSKQLISKEQCRVSGD